MKTKKLIEEVEVMGFDAILNSVGDRMDLEIREKKYGELVAHTVVNKMFIVGVYDGFYYRLEEKTKTKLYNLLTEYASTPVEEREEEKKYMYRVKTLNNMEFNLFFKQTSFLNLNRNKKTWLLDSEKENKIKQTTFTHSELKALGVDIEQLKEIYEEIEFFDTERVYGFGQ